MGAQHRIANRTMRGRAFALRNCRRCFFLKNGPSRNDRDLLFRVGIRIYGSESPATSSLPRGNHLDFTSHSVKPDADPLNSRRPSALFRRPWGTAASGGSGRSRNSNGVLANSTAAQGAARRMVSSHQPVGKCLAECFRPRY